MHFIHLTTRTSVLSLADPKCAQNTLISLQLGDYPAFHLKGETVCLLPWLGGPVGWSTVQYTKRPRV